MIFDKTGTLTVGRPNVVATNVFNESFDIEWKEFMAIAGTAEMQSEHPLGIALKDRVVEVSLCLLFKLFQRFCFFLSRVLLSIYVILRELIIVTRRHLIRF